MKGTVLMLAVTSTVLLATIVFSADAQTTTKPTTGTTSKLITMTPTRTTTTRITMTPTRTTTTTMTPTRTTTRLPTTTTTGRTCGTKRTCTCPTCRPCTYPPSVSCRAVIESTSQLPPHLKAPGICANSSCQKLCISAYGCSDGVCRSSTTCKCGCCSIGLRI